MQALLVEGLPWVLSLFTAVHTFMVGNKDIRGWIVAMTAQVMWSIWVVASATWGLLPLNIILWGLYIRNYLRWRRHEDDGSKLAEANRVILALKQELMKREETINLLSHETVSLRARLREARYPRVPPLEVAQEGLLSRRRPEETIVFQNPSYNDWERRREKPHAFEAGGAINAFAGGGADSSWSNEPREYVSPDGSHGIIPANWPINRPDTPYQTIGPAPEPEPLDIPSPAPSPSHDSSAPSESCSRSDYGSSSSYSDSSSSSSDNSSSGGGGGGSSD